MVTDSDTRGQLLLVGGIAIAIVFLLSIVLTNSLVVTTYTATPESADRIETVEDRETAIAQDLTTISGAVKNNTTFTNFNSTFNSTLRNYTRYRTRVSGTQSGTYANVTMNTSASEGRYIISPAGTSPPGFNPPTPPYPSDWTVATDVDHIARFNFTATDPHASGPTTIVVEGDSGSVWEIRVEDSGDVRVDPPTGSPTIVCSSSGFPSGSDDIEVDLVAGECTAGGTTSTFTTFAASLDKPYSIQVEKRNKIKGSFWYASTGSFPSGTSGGYAVVPAVDIAYTGPETGYERTVILENST